MPASDERPEIQLRGLGRKGAVRGAVLVLEGATVSEVRRAAGLSGLLTDRCLLVAVDGGLHACRRARLRPDLFVGDRDSVTHVPASLPAVVYPRDKDFNDLAGALVEARRRGAQVVTLAGLLGGRLDHEWANVFELGARSRWFAGILAPSDRGTVLITSRGCRAFTVRDQTVSLLALGSGAVVSMRGTRWKLDRRRLRPGSRGLSNLTGTELRLTVHSGSVALVFPTVTTSQRVTP